MTKFIRFKEAGTGNPLAVNPQNLTLAIPNGGIVNTSKIVLLNGAALAVEGSFEETLAALEGKEITEAEEISKIVVH